MVANADCDKPEFRRADAIRRPMARFGGLMRLGLHVPNHATAALACLFSSLLRTRFSIANGFSRTVTNPRRTGRSRPADAGLAAALEAAGTASALAAALGVTDRGDLAVVRGAAEAGSDDREEVQCAPVDPAAGLLPRPPPMTSRRLRSVVGGAVDCGGLAGPRTAWMRIGARCRRAPKQPLQVTCVQSRLYF